MLVTGLYKEIEMLRKDLKLDKEIEGMATSIVDSAYKVHQQLGPGLLENVYETCLVHELRKKNINTETQVTMPIVYDGIKLDAGLRIDMLVNKKIVIELKAVENLLPVHKAQLLTYLKLSNRQLGFLMNFNVPLIKHGIKRMVL
jgi:GxxExxY protein